MRITATVNGECIEADDVCEGENLLFVLRERMGLPGSKNACEQGECARALSTSTACRSAHARAGRRFRIQWSWSPLMATNP